MPAEQSSADTFLSLFSKGDVDGATALLNSYPELAVHNEYSAHPLLRSFVANNDGNCYKDSHMRIACLLYTSPSPRDATLSRMPSSA